MTRWLAARWVSAFLDRQSRFRLSATWWVPVKQEAVVPLLEDLLGYPGWWPDIRQVTPAGGDAAVVIRGVLPYRLRLTVSPLSGWGQGIEAVLRGDLQGRSAWTVTPAGGRFIGVLRRGGGPGPASSAAPGTPRPSALGAQSRHHDAARGARSPEGVTASGVY